ncbi:MAG: NAD-dependent epimerase/dehydratase family protein [Betaproteobacteria bacterium]|nr:NAD-dependent epimerase/dehydratase family protein [Betaproteobacteria bacterium]
MNNPLAFSRNAAALLHDIAACAAAWLLAFLLRFNFDMPPEFAVSMWTKLLWVVPLQTAIFWRLGLYRGLWRYASITDFRRIVASAAMGAMAIAIVLFFFQLRETPRSALVLYPILLVSVMAGSRVAYRAWKEGHLVPLSRLDAKRAIVLGAGSAAARLLETVARSRDWVVVGLLDDDPRKYGREIHGVKVIGRLDDLPSLARTLNLEQAVIALPGQAHTARKRAIDLCREAGVAALTVPSYEDLVSGRVSLSAVRKVEVDDLLGRDPVELDASGLQQWLQGRVVMVTGAGGSIGSELCRQIARYEPSRIVLFELNEFALYTIEQEFAARPGPVRVTCVLGDVRDEVRLRAVMDEWRPAVVFHAAAYKHVPMVETGNAWEGIRNNVLGTWRTARLAREYAVEKFVLVSTDKAVNPTSVMGTSKRLAEMMCQSLQQDPGTRFVMVRFGNVLGSTGSVIPKFREQIAAGGPVTVTHPDMTRYFMSIPEAAQLVLQAGLMGEGGEIFVLDMGEPVRIVDLAREMIRLSGLDEQEVSIVFTGLRPGEKLFEEVLADDETTLPTPHPKLRIARSRPTPAAVVPDILDWLQGQGVRTDADVRAGLVRWVPEYQPPERAETPAGEGVRAPVVRSATG